MNVAKTDRTFYGIQALRAIAALMVVLVHCVYLWHTRILHESDPSYWMSGASGVDIFFLISGFVMTISLPSISTYENRARVFLWRRITRIVPLYWLATTLKVIILLAVPAVAMHPNLKVSNVIASYLFIPARNADGIVAPVIIVGWTLNYEMFFYLIFAGSLLVRRSSLPLLIPVLSVFAFVGLLHPLSGPAILSFFSPLLFEFLFGVFLACALMNARVPGPWGSAILAGIGWALILSVCPRLPQGPMELQKWRFVLWGFPAAAIVLGTIGLEPILKAKLPKWMVEAGDASYAVYLVHTFVLPVVGIVVSRMAIKPFPALSLIICTGMPLSFFAGDVIHRFIELPILAKLKRVNVPGGSAVSRAGV